MFRILLSIFILTHSKTTVAPIGEPEDDHFSSLLKPCGANMTWHERGERNSKALQAISSDVMHFESYYAPIFSCSGTLAPDGLDSLQTYNYLMTESTPEECGQSEATIMQLMSDVSHKEWSTYVDFKSNGSVVIQTLTMNAEFSSRSVKGVRNVYRYGFTCDGKIRYKESWFDPMYIVTMLYATTLPPEEDSEELHPLWDILPWVIVGVIAVWGMCTGYFRKVNDRTPDYRRHRDVSMFQ